MTHTLTTKVRSPHVPMLRLFVCDVRNSFSFI
jgi:hypothetical protein